MGRSSDNELIESVYAVALEPERYEELVLIWNNRFIQSPAKIGQVDANFIDDFRRSLIILQNIKREEGTDEAKTPFDDYETSHFAVLGVAENGDIVQSNMAAKDAFGHLDFYRIDTLPYDQGSLEALSKAIAETFAGSQKQHLIRAIRTDQDSVSLISLRLLLPADRPLVMVQTSDFVWPKHMMPLLKSAFDLTPAEAEIVGMVTQGATLGEVAQKRESSLSTVRTQMKSILNKTETHSQTELVRMAIAFVSINVHADVAAVTADKVRLSEPFPNETLAYPKADQRYTLRLPDGRTLDYSIIGDPDGEPVLHINPIFWGDFWPASHISKIVERGLKIIAPARPGYMRSSLCPDGKSPSVQYAKDVHHLITHLNLEKVTILARGMATQHAYEILFLNPDIVKGLLLITPEMPYKMSETYANLSPAYRFVLNTALSYPKLLELYIKAARIFYGRVSTREFIEKHYEGANADFHILDNAEIMEALKLGLDAAYASGTKAILQTLQDIKDYDYEQVLACKVPVTAIIAKSVGSPRRVILESLVASGAAIDLVELEDIAMFCFYIKPDLVLDRLKAWAGGQSPS